MNAMNKTVNDYLLNREPKEYDAHIEDVLFAECDPDYCTESGIPIHRIVARVSTPGGFDAESVYNCILTEFSTSKMTYSEDPKRNEILPRLFINELYRGFANGKYWSYIIMGKTED